MTLWIAESCGVRDEGVKWIVPLRCCFISTHFSVHLFLLLCPLCSQFVVVDKWNTLTRARACREQTFYLFSPSLSLCRAFCATIIIVESTHWFCRNSRDHSVAVAMIIIIDTIYRLQSPDCMWIVKQLNTLKKAKHNSMLNVYMRRATFAKLVSVRSLIGRVEFDGIHSNRSGNGAVRLFADDGVTNSFSFSLSLSLSAVCSICNSQRATWIQLILRKCNVPVSMTLMAYVFVYDSFFIFRFNLFHIGACRWRRPRRRRQNYRLIC